MDETIYIKYSWKIKDIVEGYKYYTKGSNSRSISTNVFFGAILIIHGVTRLLSEPLNFFTVYLLFIGLYLLFRNQINNLRFKLRCKNLNYENKLIEWEISNSKVIYRMIDLSECIYNWEIFKGILDTPEGFLLYLSKYSYYWLPKSKFKNDEDVAQFAFMAQDKVKNWQQIK